jgi:hypothetical protein
MFPLEQTVLSSVLGYCGTLFYCCHLLLFLTSFYHFASDFRIELMVMSPIDVPYIVT